MDGRSLVWVGLFGGAAIVLVAWLLLGETDAPTVSSTANTENEGAKTPRFATRPDADQLVSSRAARVNDLRDRMLLHDVSRGAVNEGGVASHLQANRFDASSEGLSAAVTARKADLDSCFLTAKFHEPELSSTFELSVTLVSAETGGLSLDSVKARLPSGQDPAILEGCVKTVLSGVRFTGQPATLSHAIALSEQ